MIKNKNQMYIVIGAFALVLMLFTTTFAFFNYTRTEASNVIKVGRIFFESKNEETITLNNIFPIDPSNTTDMNDPTKVGTYSIDIKGDTDYVDGIEYLVSAVDANIYTSEDQIVPISLDITVTGLGTSKANYFTARESKNANIYKQLVGDTLIEDGMLLVGYIKKNTTNGQAEGVDGSITIKAYLDESKILISDTYDGTESNNMGTSNSMADGKTVLTTTEWNALKNNGVSFKVKVEANEGIWVPVQGNAMNNFPMSITSNKSMIKEIYFVQLEKDEMYEAYDSATIKSDLTYNNEGEVLAWLTTDAIDNSKYNLYIASDGITILTTGHELFSYFDNVEKIVFENVNTSRVTDMQNMFYHCAKLDNLDISMFDMSNVTTVQYMFKECSDLKNYNFNNINLSNVQIMLGMFQDCISLIDVDLSNFNTSSVTNMYALFEGCTNLETINLSGMGGNNLTGSLYLFNECPKIKSINMSNFNFGTSSMYNLFYSLPLLETINLTGVNTSKVVSMASLFEKSSNIESIDLHDVDMSSVETISNMFYDCTKLKNVNLSNTGGDNLRYINDLFKNCINLKNINMSGFNFGKITSLATTNSPFYQNTIIETVNLSNIKKSSLTAISGMLKGCSNLKYVDMSNWNLETIATAQLFENCSNLLTIDLSGITTISSPYNMFNGDTSLTTIYVSDTIDFSNQPAHMPIFTGCTSLVGGNGTTYDASHIDKEYAIIDGTNGQPGYLTLKTN